MEDEWGEPDGHVDRIACGPGRNDVAWFGRGEARVADDCETKRAYQVGAALPGSRAPKSKKAAITRAKPKPDPVTLGIS